MFFATKFYQEEIHQSFPSPRIFACNN